MSRTNTSGDIFFTFHKTLLFGQRKEANPKYRGGTTRTGDFKRREVKTGFCRKRLMQTGSSGTVIGWKSGQTTFVPLWDRMEGAWLWTLNTYLGRTK